MIVLTIMKGGIEDMEKKTNHLIANGMTSMTDIEGSGDDEMTATEATQKNQMVESRDSKGKSRGPPSSVTLDHQAAT